MGAHTTLFVTHNQAARIYRECCGIKFATLPEMEKFFDQALDKALYNVVILENEDTKEKLSDHTVEYHVRDYLKENPQYKPVGEYEENQILRELLAIRVAGVSLYRDDGELQDNTVMPTIDFKRDSARVIAQKLIERNDKTWATARSFLGG